MVALSTNRDFRAVQKLPFCYLCGEEFRSEDIINRDHIPPQNSFAVCDRTPSLWLPTHEHCNSAHKMIDEKIGQIISLKWGYVPSDPKNRRLRFTIFNKDLTAVNNVNIDGALSRWIRGFHAALYNQFLAETPLRALVTPFPRTQNGSVEMDKLRPQHLKFVSTIKLNRAKRNVDRILSNNGKCIYECVWHQDDDKSTWLCIFALNVYDWKDLGETGVEPSRGCAGAYTLAATPSNATRAVESPIALPNLEPLDPFGR